MTLDQEGGFEQLMSMARGFSAAKMLTVAVNLAVFDFLDSPRSAVEVAARLKADARAAGIFLNGLAALGLLVKEVDYFHNSKIVSRYLVQGKDDYRGAIIKHLEHTWERGWNGLQNTVLTGHPQGVEPETWVDTRPRRDEEGVKGLHLGYARRGPGPGARGDPEIAVIRGAPPPGPGGRPGHLRHRLRPGQPGLAGHGL